MYLCLTITACKVIVEGRTMFQINLVHITMYILIWVVINNSTKSMFLISRWTITIDEDCAPCNSWSSKRYTRGNVRSNGLALWIMFRSKTPLAKEAVIYMEGYHSIFPTRMVEPNMRYWLFENWHPWPIEITGTQSLSIIRIFHTPPSMLMRLCGRR